ncbi:hypothetical protein EW026_g1781 [Hermanssonia centrifuga]|uniref:Cytochrome P450 n=1 Tax=Hermanssonia centrifuga TaxID=98765 RepID=A0A4S4KQB6_9APHY|nr:hypothetical protein EW026_g1781 [Hermanssonia centrifuga]
MAGELVARAQTSILFLSYGARLKECRRLVHSWVNKHAVSASWPAQEAGSYKLLGALLDDPEGFSEHIRTQAGSVILKLTYGIECKPVNDPHIAMAEQLSKITAQATQPGRWLCDSFPSLVHVPAWFPGAEFRRWAEQARKISTELVHIPFEIVRTSILNGTATPSWTANEIVDEKGHVKSAEEARDLITAAGTMYSGGIDTTVGAVRTFFLMMARHPEIQRKAQAEIDSVVGHERLPDINDRDSLPYISQLITEVLRFNPIAPIVPHSLDEDDVYEGYLIPKGAWVMVNLWAILHDPNTYRDPEEFRPERFEGTKEYPAEPDCTQISFGFGRRSCPGYHFAMSTLFYNFTHVLSAFNIEPVKDAEGKPQIPPPEFVAGHLRAPRPFKCAVVPRSLEKVKLVRQAVVAASGV